jgi:PEP-CTERM motif
MKAKLIGLVSATAFACAVAAPAFAGGMTNWDFYTLLNSQGYNNESVGSTSDVFTQTPDSLFALSVSQMGSADAVSGDCEGSWCASTLDLWAKNGGTTNEQGLGLAGDPYGDGGEIFYPNGVYLDTQDVSGHVTSFTIGSVQGTSKSGESWEVQAWNGTAWATLGSGTGGGVVTLTGDFAAYDQFIISEPSSMLVNGSNDIVLMDMTTVPEPGTLALLAGGLLGCAFFVSRRRRARQS